MPRVKHMLISLIVVLAAISVNAVDVRATCVIDNYRGPECTGPDTCPTSYEIESDCLYTLCPGCRLEFILFGDSYCEYDSKDTNKPTCNTCQKTSCTTSGWSTCQADSTKDGTACVTPHGLGGVCENGVCELPAAGCPRSCTGTGLNEAQCGTENNRIGECVSGCCEYGKCDANNKCASGYCCVDDPSGPKPNTGICVQKGIYSGNRQYLCDPPEWTTTETSGVTQNEQSMQSKNIIRRILDIFLAL